MIEKVNPSHPDKIADRIAGAIVDMAYIKEKEPRIAVEVLLGHGHCFVIIESSVEINKQDITKAVKRINGKALKTKVIRVSQDSHLPNDFTDFCTFVR